MKLKFNVFDLYVELGPCPFCHSSTAVNIDANDLDIWIECSYCLVTGPRVSTDFDTEMNYSVYEMIAKRTWNWRCSNKDIFTDFYKRL